MRIVQQAWPPLIYKISNLFLVTSCFSLWELLINWLAWMFGQRKAFHLFDFLIVRWSNRICCRVSTSYYSNRVHARQVHKSFFSIFTAVFGWTYNVPKAQKLQVFRANLGKYGQNVPCTHKNCLLLHLWQKLKRYETIFKSELNQNSHIQSSIDPKNVS